MNYEKLIASIEHNLTQNSLIRKMTRESNNSFIIKRIQYFLLHNKLYYLYEGLRFYGPSSHAASHG